MLDEYYDLRGWTPLDNRPDRGFSPLIVKSLTRSGAHLKPDLIARMSGEDMDTSTLQNPTNICYPSAGTFAVTLVSTNANGSGTLTKTGLLADWGSRGEHIVKEGVTSVQQISNTWFDLAKKNFGYYANKLSYKLSALAAGP